MSTAAPPPTRPLQALLSLAWPMIISRASQVVVGLADAIMISSLGEAALAATITGAMNFFNCVILPMGTVFIVQSFAAQLTGKHDREGARRFAWYGLGIALFVGVLAVLGLPLVDDVLAQFAYAEDVRALMTTYMTVRLLSLGAAVGIEALGAYFGGIGNTRLPMLANIALMLLNVGFNWVFIFGNIGAPALGTEGAAVASALATVLAFAGLFGCFLLGIGGGARRSSALQLSELWRTLRFGLPAGLNWFFEFLAFSFFLNIVLAGLGTTTLAAFMLVLQLNGVAFMPAFGLASAGAILVGQSIGADRKDEVPSTAWLTIKTAAVWMVFIGALYLLVPTWLLATVADAESVSPAFFEIGKKMLMLSVAWQLFDACAITLSEVLRAAGDTAFPMWARTAIAWGIFAPGSWFTVRELGYGEVPAILWMVGYLGVLTLVLWWRFASGAWRNIELVEPAALP